VEEQRAPLDLVDRGRRAGGLRDVVDERDFEVAHTDLPGKSCLAGFDEGPPHLRVGRALSWPVDEPEVDVVGLQQIETLSKNVELLSGSSGRALGREEDVVA